MNAPLIKTISQDEAARRGRDVLAIMAEANVPGAPCEVSGQLPEEQDLDDAKATVRLTKEQAERALSKARPVAAAPMVADPSPLEQNAPDAYAAHDFTACEYSKRFGAIDVRAVKKFDPRPMNEFLAQHPDKRDAVMEALMAYSDLLDADFVLRAALEGPDCPVIVAEAEALRGAETAAPFAPLVADPEAEEAYEPAAVSPSVVGDTEPLVPTTVTEMPDYSRNPAAAAAA